MRSAPKLLRVISVAFLTLALPAAAVPALGSPAPDGGPVALEGFDAAGGLAYTVLVDPVLGTTTIFPGAAASPQSEPDAPPFDNENSCGGITPGTWSCGRSVIARSSYPNFRAWHTVTPGWTGILTIELRFFEKPWFTRELGRFTITCDYKENLLRGEWKPAWVFVPECKTWSWGSYRAGDEISLHAHVGRAAPGIWTAGVDY